MAKDLKGVIRERLETAQMIRDRELGGHVPRKVTEADKRRHQRLADGRERMEQRRLEEQIFGW